LTPLVLGVSIEGEAREVARVIAIARQTVVWRQPVPPPVVLLSGGETTVTVTRRPQPDVSASAGDTDGEDGAEEIAGAVVTPDTLARAMCTGHRFKGIARQQRGQSCLRH